MPPLSSVGGGERLMPDVGAGAWVALVWAALALLTVAHLWYAAGLARLFRALGGEPWRAWVPFLNEAEVHVRGGAPWWNVILLLVPGLNVYGAVVRARAAHRIGASRGRGGGTTVLAVLLPPVWAFVVAAPPFAASPARPETIPAPSPASPLPPTPLVAGEPVVPLPPPPHAPEPVPRSPWSPVAGRDAPAPMPAPAPIPTRGPGPEPAPAPAPLSPPGMAAAPAMPGGREPQPVPPPTPTPTSGRWVLVLDDGLTHPISGPAVVLGRRPSPTCPGDVALALEDGSRTLSKVHARLELTPHGWVLTDLGSTNGSRVADEEGRLRPVAPNTPSPVFGRFQLGDVGLEVRRL